jgi:hypothetical protein
MCVGIKRCCVFREELNLVTCETRDKLWLCLTWSVNFRARPSVLSDIKDKLLRLLLAQSHGLLLSSGCPLDEVSMITTSHLFSLWVHYCVGACFKHVKRFELFFFVFVSSIFFPYNVVFFNSSFSSFSASFVSLLLLFFLSILIYFTSLLQSYSPFHKHVMRGYIHRQYRVCGSILHWQDYLRIQIVIYCYFQLIFNYSSKKIIFNKNSI